MREIHKACGRVALILGAALSLSACAGGAATHLDSQTRGIEKGLTTLSASSRQLFVFDDGHTCLAPPPDSAEDIGEDLNLTLPLSVSTASGGEAAFDDQIPLGGRGSNVLVTRDLIFELCLSEHRHKLTRDEKIDRWNRMLEAIVKINKQPLDPSGTSMSEASVNVPVPTAGGGGSQ